MPTVQVSRGVDAETSTRSTRSRGPRGLTFPRTDQDRPSQCIVIDFWPLGLLAKHQPTAQALSGPLAETPERVNPKPGFGLDTTDHSDPSQCSIGVFPCAPTAHTS